jgi:hypothetical protein
MNPSEKLRQHEDVPIDLSREADQNFINREIEQSLLDRDNSAQEAREVERALCGQLILVATVLLTASMFAVGNSDPLNKMSYGQKYLTLLAILALISSIGAGIKYYFILQSFYNDWARAKNGVAHLYSNVDFTTPLEARGKAYEKTKHLDNKPKNEWLKRQIWLVVAAGGIYCLLLIAVFFDFRDITRHLSIWLQ